MSTIDNLLKKKKQYYNLLDKVELTKKNIDDSINYLNSGVESYNKSYTIDGKIADNNILSNVKTSLNNISTRLSTDIEKINYELSKLGKQIDRYYEEAAALAAMASSKPKQEQKEDTNTNNASSNTSNKSIPNKTFREERLKW